MLVELFYFYSMCFKHFATIALAVFIVSCGARKESESVTTQTSYAVRTETAKLSRIATDTVVISERAAIFFDPDTVQIEKAKKECLEEDDFYTAADDNLYYMWLASNFIDSVKLKKVDIMGKKVLKFVSATGGATFVNLDTVNWLWGVYFFDPQKKPHDADVVSIEEEYHKYFKQ